MPSAASRLRHNGHARDVSPRTRGRAGEELPYLAGESFPGRTGISVDVRPSGRHGLQVAIPIDARHPGEFWVRLYPSSHGRL